MEQTLLDAEALLGVCITVYDLTGVFHDNEGRSLLGPARESHRQRSVLCGLGFHGRRCKAHCRERVSRWVADHPEGIAHRCWKGLMEVAVPIRRQGVLLATLLAGQWREPEARDENVEGCSAPWREAFDAAPVFDPEVGQQTMRVLAALGQGLLSHIDRAFDLDDAPETRALQIQRFLRYHATTRVRLDDLAAVLHLSPSRTSHLVRQELGMSFQELLKQERIRRARSLLRSTDLPIRQIAQRVGIDNEYYFSRLFKRTTGRTPGGYRRGGQ